MSILLLFFPGFITLNIRSKRTKKEYKDILKSYPLYTIFINFISLIIVYLYNNRNINYNLNECFNSISFALKYLMLSSIIAFFLPYIIEYITKNFNISMEIRKKNYVKDNK